MLNREQRKALKYLNAMRRTPAYFDADTFYRKMKTSDIERMFLLCKDLQKTGWIKDVHENISQRLQNVELEYKGLNYKAEFRKQIFVAVSSWIFDNIVSLAALVVSIIALVNSAS